VSSPRRGAVRTFLWGSVVGGALAVFAPRVRRRPRPWPPGEPVRAAGLRAFEGAPCWEWDRHAHERAADEARPTAAD
jgi:hypothetical protein